MSPNIRGAGALRPLSSSSVGFRPLGRWETLPMVAIIAMADRQRMVSTEGWRRRTALFRGHPPWRQKSFFAEDLARRGPGSPYRAPFHTAFYRLLSAFIA